MMHNAAKISYTNFRVTSLLTKISHNDIILFCLWKHHVNLLLQSFRSVNPDLHHAVLIICDLFNSHALALIKMRAYGSNALQ